MKKILFCLIASGLLWSCSFAYQPTSNDMAQINLLKNQLTAITTGNMKDKRAFYAQIKTLQEQFSWYDQLNYYLDALGLNLITEVNIEKVKTKIIAKQFKQDFFNIYSGGFSQDISTPDSCTGRYNTMDTISFANNFPTALTIATRYRETNCGYYMPANTNGPFQIISKNYWTGQISEAKFIQTIQDFIDFSQSKYQQYKSKLWVKLTYTGFDRTGLVDHAGLYNGGIISWSIVNPINPKYAFDGYGQDYSWAARYWLIPKFLKVVDWELKNSY